MPIFSLFKALMFYILEVETHSASIFPNWALIFLILHFQTAEVSALGWGTVGSFSGPERDGAEEIGSSGWFRSWLSVPCEKALLEVWGSPAPWCFCPTWIFYLVTAISRLCRFVMKGLLSPTPHASGSFSTINCSKKKVYSNGSVFNQFWLSIAPFSW